MRDLLTVIPFISHMVESPFDVTIKVGKIKRAEEFSEAREPKMCKLWIDLGEVNIACFRSEVLTVGVSGEDDKPVLITPEKEVLNGGLLY